MMAQPRPLRWPPVFPLEKGLVLWLLMDDRSGAKAHDRSGKGNHGTLNAPTWIAGRRGGALIFDGVDDYVEVPDASNLRLTTRITIAMWLYPTDVTGGNINKRFLSKATEDNGYELYIQTNAKPAFASRNSGVLHELGWNNSIPLSSWSHLSAVYNGAQKLVYTNGILDNSTAFSSDIGSNTSVLYLGQSTWLTREFKGAITGVRIYNRALSAAEVKRLYESEIMLARW